MKWRAKIKGGKSMVFAGCITEACAAQRWKLPLGTWNNRPREKTMEDYQSVIADHDRLVRELDIALNGEHGAAKQASLCDIVAQVREEWRIK